MTRLKNVSRAISSIFQISDRRIRAEGSCKGFVLLPDIFTCVLVALVMPKARWPKDARATEFYYSRQFSQRVSTIHDMNAVIPGRFASCSLAVNIFAIQIVDRLTENLGSWISTWRSNRSNQNSGATFDRSERLAPVISGGAPLTASAKDRTGSESYGCAIWCVVVIRAPRDFASHSIFTSYTFLRNESGMTNRRS
jgi:hypothetical protein